MNLLSRGSFGYRKIDTNAHPINDSITKMILRLQRQDQFVIIIISTREKLQYKFEGQQNRKGNFSKKELTRIASFVVSK